MADGIIFTAGPLRTVAHGDLRLTVHIDKADAKYAMELFGTPGTPGAMVRVTPEAAQKDQVDKAASPYGQQARALRLSSFLRTPDVWAALGTDAEYLAWVREQGCCAPGCKAPAPSEAAHVRRVASGAGTGIKPQYSAVPLCPTHHSVQHQHGESAVGGKDYIDGQRITYLVEWGWEALKRHLGAESMAQVPPGEVLAWCQEREIERYLPEEYRL